jgi:hypothetical protein
MSNKPEAKLRELILYVASMCWKDEGFAKTKLNKILFNIDFDAFRKWGKSISGRKYLAKQYGPVPDIMDSMLSMMQRRKEIAIQSRDYHGKEQLVPVPLREYDHTMFTRDEMNLIYEHINEYWQRSGTSMSNASHEFVGWRVARPREPIPYEVSLVGTREPTLSEIQRGQELEHFAKECLARNASGETQDYRRRT